MSRTQSYGVSGVTVVALLGALVAASHVAASPSIHNHDTYIGNARVFQYGRIVDSCRVVVRLTPPLPDVSAARVEVPACQNKEPFLGCAIPLRYVVRAEAPTWIWRVSGRGKSLKGQTCIAPRSIPSQYVQVKHYGSRRETMKLTLHSTRGGPALDATLRRT